MSLPRVWTPILPSLVVALLLAVLWPGRAAALDQMCDSSFQNCRAEVLNRIRAEAVEVSVGAWFVEDLRFTTELINRWRAGVRVRVLADPRANLQAFDVSSIGLF